MANITFITSNPAKVALANERLNQYGISASQQKLELDEVQSFDVTEVARKKAEQALKQLATPFIVEDSGFYIKALKGFPGPMVKLIMGTLGDERLTRILNPEDSKEVEVASVAAYGDPATGEIKIFEGLYSGTIAEKPRGDITRGWLLTKIFIPRNGSKTLAELDDTEWAAFLEDFRKNDHFDKFGEWLSTKA